MQLRPALLLAALLGLATPAPAASPDNNVEWSGISHLPELDRVPRCPVDFEPFAVRVQAWANDLTGVNVHHNANGTTVYAATVVGQRGPYDLWEVVLPQAPVTLQFYAIELIDGSDSDWYGPAGMSETQPLPGFPVDFVNLAHAPLGVTPVTGGGHVFRVWSPNSSQAAVRGQFSNWNPVSLSQQGEHFVGRVFGSTPGQRYKYFFDNSVWNTDPRALRLRPDDNLNAELVDTGAYQWQNGFPSTRPKTEMVIYQLHPGTFAGVNDPYGSASWPSDLADVEARLDHLSQLGVNCIMLNPIQEFPGDNSVGYNPTTQFGLEFAYGHPDDFKSLVDAAHARGIAVVLDIVWNHFSPSDNFLFRYDGGPSYFDDPAVDTQWGAQADFDHPEVRDYFLDSALLWLEDYRADGFRMDATDFMNIFPQEAAGWSLMQELNDLVDNRRGDRFLFAEQLPDDPWVTRPTSLGGAGFDAQYLDFFRDTLHQEILDAGFGNPEMWKLADILDGAGEYLWGPHLVNYLELHDEAWDETGGSRLPSQIDTSYPHDDQYARGRTKLGQGFVLMSQGVPAFLQGAEWLEQNNFGSNPGNRIDWANKTTYAGYFAYFVDAVHLRTATPALYADRPVHVHHVNDGGNVIAWRRWDAGAGSEVVVLANFSNTDYGSYRVGVPQGGNWVERLNSESFAYGGSGPENSGLVAADAIGADSYGQSVDIALPAMGLVVLTPAAPTGTPDGPGGRTSGLYLRPPVVDAATVSLRTPVAGDARLRLHDARGRAVATVFEGRLEAGWHELPLRAPELSRGVYFLRLEAGGAVAARKLVRSR